MSIRLLKTLIAVADHQTFAAAAQGLSITHAAVSQHMRSLEAELGITLFDRSRRSPDLTPLGRAVVARARRIVQDYETLVPSVLDLDGVRGELTLGAVPTTLTGLAPRAMALLRDACPQLGLRIHPAQTSALLAGIARGQVDAAVISQPPTLPVGLVFHEIAEEPLALVVSAARPGGDPLDILATQPFIRFNRTAVVGTLIESWLQRTGIQVREVMELDNLEAICSMVDADLGVSIVPVPCVPAALAPDVRHLSLSPAAPTRILGLACRAEHPRFRAIGAVLEALRRAVAEAGGAPALRAEPAR